MDLSPSLDCYNHHWNKNKEKTWAWAWVPATIIELLLTLKVVQQGVQKMERKKIPSPSSNSCNHHQTTFDAESSLMRSSRKEKKKNTQAWGRVVTNIAKLLSVPRVVWWCIKIQVELGFLFTWFQAKIRVQVWIFPSFLAKF